MSYMSLSKLFARRQKADALPEDEREKYKALYAGIVADIENKALPIHTIMSHGVCKYIDDVDKQAEMDYTLWAALEVGDWDKLASLCKVITKL